MQTTPCFVCTRIVLAVRNSIKGKGKPMAIGNPPPPPQQLKTFLWLTKIIRRFTSLGDYWWCVVVVITISEFKEECTYIRAAQTATPWQDSCPTISLLQVLSPPLSLSVRITSNFILFENKGSHSKRHISSNGMRSYIRERNRRRRKKARRRRRANQMRMAHNSSLR